MHATLIVTLAALLTQAPANTAATDILSIQVALDRAGFSPGVIDGRDGANTRRALEHYRKMHQGDPPAVEPLTTYTITETDVQGPFAEHIPADLVEQASLPALAYTSAVEALAERFHATPELLRRLNPDATFAAGEQIRVPDVAPFIVPAPRLGPPPPGHKSVGTAGRREAAGREEPAGPEVVVTVSKSDGALVVRDSGQRVLFVAPVTTGSDHDPLPIGEWTVNGVQVSPAFHYNPDLFWDADPSHAKATIKPGPNNPVGVVWIDLSKEHYGIHGTPEPAAIGRSASHGCVRLTNWDALKLAGMVRPGTKVVFTQ